MEAMRMSIVKSKNKKSGITYVYESESYWDKEKKQPRNNRKLIGKIDDLTGNIVPTRGHGRIEDSVTLQQDNTELCSLCQAYKKQNASQEDLIRSQATEITRLKTEKKEMLRGLMELAKIYGV
jgi:hypothetical protein